MQLLQEQERVVEEHWKREEDLRNEKQDSMRRYEDLLAEVVHGRLLSEEEEKQALEEKERKLYQLESDIATDRQRLEAKQQKL